MSLRDDVILRVIHQLVEALLKAAGFRKKKDLPATEEALGEGLKALGLTLDLARTMPASTLRDIVQDPIRRALLGSALCELAALAREKGDLAGGDQLDDTATDILMDIDVKELPAEVLEVLPADMRE